MSGTDSHLVSRTLGGDNKAFDELVERYRDRAFRVAMRKVEAREEAVDITQEAFVRAYMSLSTLSDPERFAPWLMAIIGNLYKMRLRKTHEITIAADVMDTIHTPEPAADPCQVHNKFECLPEGTRTAAILFFFDGLRQSEIATKLGISIPAVKARIREARTRLQKEMIDMAPRSKTHEELDEGFTDSLRRKLELARWYREFAEHLESGTSIMHGLHVISKGDYSSPLLDSTKKMMDAIESGGTITEALTAIPALASSEASGMIRAGEAIGSLHIAARFISDRLDAQDAQRNIELIFWCRTFGYLLAAQAPMTETLNHGLSIAGSKALGQATRDIVAVLEATELKRESGSRLRPVLDKYPDVFPPICRLAFLAGEMTGELYKTLMWVADEMADDLARSIARSAVPSPRELSPRQFGVTDVAQILPGPCLKLLSDHAPDIRAAAADALSRLGHKDAGPAIAQRLDDESAEVRKTAVRVIAELGYQEAQQQLVDLINDKDPLVRKAAIESIARLDGHWAAQALAEAIQDPDHRVMAAAIETLKAVQATDVMARKATQLFGSESREDQGRAAYLLRHFLPAKVLQDLISSLESTSNGLTPNQISGIVALGLYGCKETTPLLNRIVQDPDHAQLATRALREVGDASSVAAIIEAVQSGALGPDYLDLARELEKRAVD